LRIERILSKGHDGKTVDVFGYPRNDNGTMTDSTMRGASTAQEDLKRFFITLEKPPVALPQLVSLSDEFTVHHLRTVCRAKSGEGVVAVDGVREVAYRASIQAISKQSVELQLEAIVSASSAALPPVTLAVALLKEQRWDLVLQKATELGVRTIHPLMAERSVVKLNASDLARKTERWQAVARSAAEQSEGLFIPEICVPMRLADFLATPSQPDARSVLLLERGAQRQSLRTVFSSLTAQTPVIMAIGPEGGWAPSEINQLTQAGFAEASLGGRILRSETAVLAAMAAVVYALGE
jgi:16S rRNA (uracil1498-N3)-methyltransferase